MPIARVKITDQDPAVVYPILCDMTIALRLAHSASKTADGAWAEFEVPARLSVDDVHGRIREAFAHPVEMEVSLD